MSAHCYRVIGMFLIICIMQFVAVEAVQLYPSQGVEMPPMPARPVSNDVDEILHLIESQLDAIASKQYEVAYNSYNASQFRQSTTFNEFKYFVTGHAVFAKNKNAIFGNVDFKKQYASIQGTLTSVDGHSQKVQYFLVKEGGLWKVAGIQLIHAPELAPPPSRALQESYDPQSDIEM